MRVPLPTPPLLQLPQLVPRRWRSTQWSPQPAAAERDLPVLLPEDQVQEVVQEAAVYLSEVVYLLVGPWALLAAAGLV